MEDNLVLEMVKTQKRSNMDEIFITFQNTVLFSKILFLRVTRMKKNQILSQLGYFLHHKVKSGRGRRRSSPRDMYRSRSRGFTVEPRTSEVMAFP